MSSDKTMKLMASLPDPSWTMAELRRHFGMVPAQRIVLDPAPGTATEDDVVWMDDHCDRLCELVDGVLVEKAMGFQESRLAGDIHFALKLFLREHPLGEAFTADALLRILPGMVRIPDVCFISWDRVPGDEFPEVPIGPFAPDLAVEVISKGNTKKEMERKLREYFENGCRLVWLVYPKTRTVEVYTAPNKVRRLRQTQMLDGGDVLPGFQMSLAELFAPRRRPTER